MPTRAEKLLAATLGTWLGALAMTAVAAATLFPAMKRLDPSLPGYAAYPGGHWSIAAGVPMQRIFAIADGVQLICCVLAAGLVGVPLFRRGVLHARGVELVRGGLVALAFFAMIYSLFVLTPPMVSDLHGFWDAARGGDTARADALRAAFDARHPTANRVLSVIGVGVVGALALTVATPGRAAPTGPKP
ncbi:MAG: hypothetical protein FJ255_09105 [Phycisphaerae bacterium]|nr:hypothetical protein [Phycisphaerae bacterium]